MNPATFLRVLGPEPWKVAYVEPSIRPDDGRYGENPNRMQMHYQFQVILKPDPGNPQEIYLESLEALGIDPLQHDIRFVEDNWESPALGAWGLGWEVWLDGQEITQFTYFQQAGGFVLDPVSVEITYGLDRIAIALQQVGSFRDIHWSPNLTAGEVNLQAEQEHSKYYFEIADVERLRQMYDLYEAEARACLDLGMVLPAHDYVLRCSHTFNVMDARGAVGVTERQAMFGRMRDLSRRVAEAYLEQRQKLEYPWLKDQAIEQSEARDMGITGQVVSPLTNVPMTDLETHQPFLLEIGTEELPVGDLGVALEQLRGNLAALLDELHLEHGEIRILGTPRRLVALVDDLAPNQPDTERIIKGPPADRAFNPDGTPTKAAEGFAHSKGVLESDLEIRNIDGGKYVVAVVRQAGRPAGTILSESLPGLLASLRFDKPMRWNSTNVFFSRPIRWLLALFGEQVVPFEFAGLYSGNRTRGLRFKKPIELAVHGPDEYFSFLAAQGILLDPVERKAAIQKQVHALAAQVKGEITEDPDLLAEVANLVEAPTALYGTFEATYLQLPREVLVSVMKKHQRYFPVQAINREASKKGGNPSLLPYFIAVRNGDSQGLDVVVDGNEHVIRARFADANFFVREDIKQPLEAYLPRLGTLAFQVKLGSMLDKTHRIEKLVDDLAGWAGLGDAELVTTRRAAKLCKADLATKMVVEMTSLQGLMGRYYAFNSGEPEAVALAIFEHYLPRYTGDILPRTKPGLVVGLADRLDTLAGLFAIGLAPSGNKDPFAQRRAALGLVQNLIAWDLDFELDAAIRAAASHLPVPAKPEALVLVMVFIVERLRNLLLDQGAHFDVVDAVLAAQGNNPARAVRAVKELAGWTARPDWNSILPAYARCVRITRDLSERYPIDPEYFAEPAEVDLYAAVSVAMAARRSPGSMDDFLNSFFPLIPLINRFFDEVLVMAEDSRLRENRLGLVQRIAALASGVADMSKLEGF
jgi:glycyl-tRNA synthetase